ncbi:MAG TPA: hypothetical protein VNH11_20715 [Pirellulales bacterium]|nr:hypothetical protein [Pirellulales bacterium]
MSKQSRRRFIEAALAGGALSELSEFGFLARPPARGAENVSPNCLGRDANFEQLSAARGDNYCGGLALTGVLSARQSCRSPWNSEIFWW